MSYRFHCEPCDYWFDRQDALKQPIAGPEDRSDYLLACPSCGELDSFEERVIRFWLYGGRREKIKL